MKFDLLGIHIQGSLLVRILDLRTVSTRSTHIKNELLIGSQLPPYKLLLTTTHSTFTLYYAHILKLMQLLTEKQFIWASPATGSHTFHTFRTVFHSQDSL